jgi:hypothetical protein
MASHSSPRPRANAIARCVAQRPHAAFGVPLRGAERHQAHVDVERHDPEVPVVPAQAGAPTGALRDAEPLPQEHVLHHEGLPTPKCDEPSADEERHPIQYGAMIADRAAHHTDGVLAPYKSSIAPA